MFGTAGHLPELIIILVIAVLILGPGKLPQVGGAVGKTIREFRKSSTEPDPEETTADSATTVAPTTVTTPTTTVSSSAAPQAKAAPAPTTKIEG